MRAFIAVMISVSVIAGAAWFLRADNRNPTAAQPPQAQPPASAQVQPPQATPPVAEQKNVPAPPQEAKSNIRFTCADEGLPKTGFWKSFPAAAQMSKNGPVAIASTFRLNEKPDKNMGPSVWTYSAEGKWTALRDGLGPSDTCGGSIAFGDLNKDGNTDIVIADECKGVSVFLGDGQGHWKEAATGIRPAVASESEANEQVFTGAESIAIGDVNEDGFPDLVVGAYDQGGMTVYLGDGTGANWKETHPDGLPSPEFEDKGGWVNKVVLADLDNDGHLDLVANHSTGPRVWRGDGKNNWEIVSNGLPAPSLTGVFRGLAVGDVNGDGKPDLIVANAINGPEVFIQRDNWIWEQLPDIFPTMQGGALDVSLVDLDGDGLPEIAVVGRKTKEPGNAYGIYIVRSDGKGNWAEVKDTGLPERGLSIAWGITSADVNNDGRPDLIVATGGIVAEPKKPAGKQEPVVSDELPLPRVQVWMNRKAE